MNGAVPLLDIRQQLLRNIMLTIMSSYIRRRVTAFKVVEHNIWCASELILKEYYITQEMWREYINS
jgi:hypothetical protein